MFFLTALLTVGLSAQAASQFDGYCAQVGNQSHLMFIDQLAGHTEGSDYVVTFVPKELDCKDGIAFEKPTTLSFVSLVDNDYRDSAEGYSNPYKMIPQVSKSNVNGHLLVTVRFVNGQNELFAESNKNRREFFLSIGFWFRTYAWKLYISKVNPERPSLVFAQ